MDSFGLECVIPFEYGHRLQRHGGKCRFLHGHSGIATLRLEYPKLDSLGFVVDLGDIKAIARSWINDHWDHALLLNRSDPLVSVLGEAVDEGSLREPQRVYLFDVEPTAENMAQELFEKIGGFFPQLVAVTIQETATGRATYSWKDEVDDAPVGR